ncbi:unnamed protein product [Heterobilharzia americana]|nr:unnamed protein product [Heterobilharzia americana]
MSSYISETSNSLFGFGKMCQPVITDGNASFIQHGNETYDGSSNLLEALLQKIHTLESERHILKLRLEAVESDYDAQVKELQTDIIAMRVDLKKERKMCKKMEKEKNTTINELIQQNQSLTHRLTCSSENEEHLREELSNLRSEFLKHKSSMQEHVQSIESLRQEITKLREEKNHLEIQLSAVVEEKNSLLESLSDSYQEVNMLRQVASEQAATINTQDAEITRLQETANVLHNRLQKLSSQAGSKSTGVNEEGGVKPVDSHPHRSLMAELAEQKMNQMENFGCLPSALEDDDDVEFEMDDNAFLAYLSCFDQDNISDKVTEIYQQMNQMCVELYALAGANQEACSQVGTHTPDELAMVEMDFRLGSLRSVLTDLRGLLKDLKIEIPEQPVSSCLSQEEKEVISNENIMEPNLSSSPLNEQDHPLANYEMECQIVRSERDALAAELLNAQQELLQLKTKIESGSGNTGEVHNLHSGKQNNFIASWEEFEEEKYEFEMPR